MVNLHAVIVKFIFALQLGFTAPQLRHLVAFVHGIILHEGRKTVTQIGRVAGVNRHLSSTTRFLNESPWSVQHLQQRRLTLLLEQIRRTKGKRVVFLLIDDTACKKKPTTCRMEALDFHFAHDEGKSVWSHSLVTMHVVCEANSFAWDFRPYFREQACEERGQTYKSKNELAMEMVASFPATEEEQVYVLADSWYTSQKMLDLCQTRGFHVIAAVKTNRKICPAGVRISISNFASQYMGNDDLCSVTVEDTRYRVYAYEGPLAETENVRVLLSWEGRFDANRTPFCIVCTDATLDLVTILTYYRTRWHIETGYRYFKELLGFDHYQLLSFTGIQRFWEIQFLTQNLLEGQRHIWSDRHHPLTLGDVVRRIRYEHRGQMLVYVYESA
ncbi:IS701 family transposase, partial [Paenibacillus enshidis]